MSTPTQTPLNILIVSSKTGGGHSSAAKALEAAFSQIAPSAKVTTVFDVLEQSSVFSKAFAALYNYLLRHHQPLMQHYFNLVNQLQLHQQGALFHIGERFGKTLLQQHQPDIIISVHPMLQHYFSWLIKRTPLAKRPKLVCVVTDPGANIWQGWADNNFDQYFVPHEHSKTHLIKHGVNAEKIQIVGMPTHPRFKAISASEKTALRQTLTLPEDKTIVLMCAGWASGGNVSQLFKYLCHHATALIVEKAHIVFIAGGSPNVLQHAEQAAQNSRLSTSVLGFVNDLAPYMQTANVIVSKAGGLTTFEALATGLPIWFDGLTPPMPQEAETITLVTQANAGRILKSADSFLLALEALLTSSEGNIPMGNSPCPQGAALTIAKTLAN